MQKFPAPGLTLLELMLVISIIALLIGAGLPTVRQFTLNQRLTAASRQLYQDLMFARDSAVSLSRVIVACPSNNADGCAANNGWQQGWLVFQDDNLDRQRQTSEPVFRVGGEHSDLTITSSVHRNRLRFYPNGTAPGNAASLVICDQRGAANAFAIVLSNSGRIRLRSAQRDNLSLQCPG